MANELYDKVIKARDEAKAKVQAKDQEGKKILAAYYDGEHFAYGQILEWLKEEAGGNCG